MRWISVDEQLPEILPYSGPRKSKAVLIWCQDNLCTYTAVFNHDEKRWKHFGYDLWVTHTVTHWMPTPPPPEPEQGVYY